MSLPTQISITQIANGYIVADAAAGMYGDSEWRVSSATFYPSLDDLAAAMPSFVVAAVEDSAKREQEQRDTLAKEEAAMRNGLNMPNPRDVAAQQMAARGAIGRRF